MSLKGQIETFTGPVGRRLSRVLEDQEMNGKRAMSAPVGDIRGASPQNSYRLRDLSDSATKHRLENLYSNTAGSEYGGEVNSLLGSASQSQKTTIVSFVIDEDQHTGDSSGAKDPFEKKNNAATVLLSVLYALVLILIGTLYPISEALRGEWLNDHVVAIFLVYLFALSSIFLVYLQVEINLHARHIKKSRMGATKNQNGDGGEISSVAPPADVETDGDKTKIVSSFKDPDKPASPSMYLYRRRRSTLPVSTGFDEGPNGTGDTASITGSVVDDVSDLNEEIYEEVSFQTQTATLGHEAASIYLRLGALLFGIGNFVLVAIELEEFYSQKGENCANRPHIYPMIFQMIFLVVQTFFILKHTHVHIKKRKGVARFGLMHVLATNACVWVRILVREVIEGVDGHHLLFCVIAIFVEDQGIDQGSHGGSHHGARHAREANDDEFGLLLDTGSGSGANYTASGYEAISAFADSNKNSSSCTSNSALLDQVSPFLFPCVLEYSLICVAVMAGIFEGLYIRVSRDVIDMIKKTLRLRHAAGNNGTGNSGAGDSHVPDGNGTHYLHPKSLFDKSHRGLYTGVLVMTGTVISIILFFYNLNTLHKQATAISIFHITDISLHTVLIIAVILAEFRLSKLHFTLSRNNSIDDRLLIFSYAGLFLFEGFIFISSVASLVYGKNLSDEETTQGWLALSAAMINIIQGLLQVIFVIDGLQRCSNRTEDQQNKPGRGFVTFMLISNVALWIFKTFQVKQIGLATQAAYYGKTPWAIILNLNLPLMLFFRFHSSVCMADIWASAYEGEHNDMGFQVLN